MRKLMSAAAIGIFIIGFFWQYGSWIGEWVGRFAGVRGVIAGYDEFVERHLPVLAIKGGTAEIVAPWVLMVVGFVAFWALRRRAKKDG